MNEKSLNQIRKEMIDEAYHAYMDGKASPEQQLIWRFANAFQCLNVWKEYHHLLSEKTFRMQIKQVYNKR
jgi:hypothetical protein